MRILVLLLILGAAGGLFAPGAILADTPDIEVLATGAESQFPDGIKFTITARSSDEIEEIRVFIRKADQSGRSAYRSVEFEPGKEVTGESVLRSGSGGADYYPPGTRIEFSFEVRDTAGGVYRTPDQEFIYADSRFDWLTVSSGLITVYYYGEFVEQRAQTVLEAAVQAMELMVPVLGIAPTDPLRIVSYNNYRHMSAALPFRAQAVREKLQTQGMAFTDERVLLVHGFDPTVKGTVSHEFVHLLVAEAAGRAVSQVPAWLNEGLAEYGNIDPTDSYDAALRYGIFTRRLKPLWYLGAFGGSPDDIIIAYGQGRSVVELMIGRYGPEKMAELMQVIQDTLDVDVALTQVYGFDQYGLDTEWREWMGIETLPPPGELERQLQAPPSPTPAPTPEPTSTSAPTPTPEPTPQLEPTQVASTEAEDGDAPSGGGCSAPMSGQDGGAVGLGTLLLLGGPLGLLSFQAFRRRRVTGRHVSTEP